MALASGGAINVIGGVTNGLLSFVFTFIIARELGASGAGAFYEAVAVFSILTIVSQLGAPAAIVRNVARLRTLGHVDDLRPTVFVAVLPGFVFACALAVLVFAFAPDLSRVLTHHEDPGAISDYLRIFALAIPLATVANVMLGATRGFGSMRPSAVIDTIIKPVTRVVLALVAFRVSRDVVSASMTWVIPVAITFVLAVAAVRKLLRDEAGRGEDPRGPGKRTETRKLAVEFWRFALPQSLSGVLQVAVLWIDVLLLGAFKGAEQAGTYATLSRYLLVGELALSAIALAISPIMSSLLTANEHTRAQSLYRLGTVWVAAVAFPLYLMMAVFAPVLMQAFGASFLEGTDALAILSVAMLVNIATGPVVVILLMGGRSDLILWNSGAAFALNILLNALLIPTFGMPGAAVAWAASVIGMNALAIAQVRRVWGIHPLGRSLALITCSAILSYGAVGLAVSHVLGRNLTALIITCVIGSVVHGITVWRTRGELGSSLLREAWQERRAALSPQEP